MEEAENDVAYARKRGGKRKRDGDFSSTRKSMTSLLVFLCPIMSVDIGEGGGGGRWGWKSLQDLCEEEKAAGGASIIFSPPTASGDASIIYLSQSGIGRYIYHSPVNCEKIYERWSINF